MNLRSVNLSLQRDNETDPDLKAKGQLSIDFGSESDRDIDAVLAESYENFLCSNYW